MKTIIILLTFALAGLPLHIEAKSDQLVITQDVKNFWLAYDAITKTNDVEEQRKLLKSFYLDQGTVGLEKVIRARSYTIEEFIQAINNHPKFWQSIRKSLSDIDHIEDKITKAISRLKDVYPDLKPANVYFTIGAFRMPGTALEGDSLIGAELAFATDKTPLLEFSERYDYLKPYFKSNPKSGLVFLNIHEYLHTQQKTTIGNSLLTQTVIEGVAEFLTEIALNVDSPNPQIDYGRQNDDEIKSAFINEMFSNNFSNWLWNSSNNQFAMRDLGYYVGYKISEGVYHSFEDKNAAVKYMIELDYNNKQALWQFVDRAGYFDQPLATIYQDIAAKQPTVESVVQSRSQQNVTGIDTLTINFSTPLDTQFTDFDIGPLGLNHVIRVTQLLGFSNNGKTVAIRIKPLEQNQHYQLLLGDNFRSSSGIRLKPYVIDIKTSS